MERRGRRVWAVAVMRSGMWKIRHGPEYEGVKLEGDGCLCDASFAEASCSCKSVALDQSGKRAKHSPSLAWTDECGPTILDPVEWWMERNIGHACAARPFTRMLRERLQGLFWNQTEDSSIRHRKVEACGPHVPQLTQVRP